MAKSPVSYEISLSVFSGPLDLLLHLIERNELDITAVSLATVADQYLEQVETIKRDRLDQLMDFLDIGARLLVIKSRALLPKNPDELILDEDGEDPAEALARQLRLYKKYKEAASWFQQREEQGFRTYLRVAPPPRLEHSLDLTNISVETLAAALRSLFLRTDILEDSISVAVRRQTVTIENQISKIRDRIRSFGRVPFSELLSNEISWAEVSITLLAVLELIKQHEVNAIQVQLFGPIEIVSAKT